MNTSEDTEERSQLALKAAYEVESISEVLQRHFQCAEAESMFVLGLAIRLEGLASVIMSSMQGQRGDVDAAHATLIGPAAAREQRRVEEG